MVWKDLPECISAVSYTHLDVYKRQELNTSVLEDVMLWITDLKGASNDEGNDKKI